MYIDVKIFVFLSCVKYSVLLISPVIVIVTYV